MLEDTLGRFDRAAWSIADSGLAHASWTELRRDVIDLIERGNAAVALVDGMYSDSWAAIRWDETDAPVVLTRAFGKVHRRLAAALDKTARTASRTATQLAVADGDLQAGNSDPDGIASGIPTAGDALLTPIPS